ncbi:MAG TPA: MFS transporter, partial [Kofleriaceae bacterium]|nr:MFS transporter [Kofleriaceae bacterium]
LLLSGPLSDRYGRRAIVLPGAVIALAASALLGAGGDSFALLLAGRFVYGIGCGAVMNPGAVWVLEESGVVAGGAGARRATIALSAGFGFGPLLSGVLAQYAPAPTILPYVVHVVALAVAIAIAATAPGGRRSPTAHPGPLLRIGLDATNRRAFFAGIAPMAPFVFAFPAIAFAALPALLGSDALGTAPIAYIGLLAATTLAAGVLVQPVTRRFTPTAAARLGLAIGAVGCAVGAAAVAWHVVPLLLANAAILGAGYGICMTAGLRRVELIARPGIRGGLTGLYYVLAYLGFAAPWLIALATRSALTGPQSLLVVAALAVLASLGLRA